MDFIPKNLFVKGPPDTLEKVRKDINMDKPGEMKEAVRILDEWVKQQPHFINKNFPLHYLEMSIVMAKGSIERAKRVIENICTARTLTPQLFEPRDPKEYYEIFKDNFSVAAVPTLTSEYYRIFIVKVSGKVFNNIMQSVYKYIFMALEYIKLHDYNSGIVLIFDLLEADLQHFITHVNMFEVRNGIHTFLETFGMRLKRAHLLSTSKVAEVTVNFFKPILSKKMSERVMVNKTVEELQQYYDKDILPKDYGGNEKTISELREMAAHALNSEEVQTSMQKLFEVRIDKSLCPAGLLGDADCLNGTFRSLNID